MARTPIPPIAPIELVELPAQSITATQNSVTTINNMLLDKTEIIKQVGRIEGLEFTRHIADVAIAQIFDSIKKSKCYKGLPYIDGKGNTQHIADLDEFCRVFLKKSARRVQELAQNLRLLGSELYEQAEQIGFRAKDYQLLRSLSIDKQELIKEAIAAEDKESTLELIQELALKYTQEKEELAKQLAESQESRQQQLDEAKTEQEVLQQRNANLSKEKEELSVKLARFELTTIPLDERLTPLKKQITETQARIDELLNQHYQYIELLEKLQFELMENSSDYDPEQPFVLPDVMQTTLLMLSSAVTLTQSQVNTIYRHLSLQFGDNLELANARFDEAINCLSLPAN